MYLFVVPEQDENGTTRPVFTYLRPLHAGRLLDTPRHAARFVSLIPYEQTAAGPVGLAPPTGDFDSPQSRADIWPSLHAFIAANKGVCAHLRSILPSSLHTVLLVLYTLYTLYSISVQSCAGLGIRNTSS